MTHGHRGLATLVFTLAFAGGAFVSARGRGRDAFARMCALTEANFYRADQRLERWLKRCHREAAELPRHLTLAGWLERARDLLETMNVSHFAIFTPGDNRRLWAGTAAATGIYSRYVDGHLIVYRVHPRSGAAAAGVAVGDEILHLPDVEEVSPVGARWRAGVYQLARRGKPFAVTLSPTILTENPAMTVNIRDDGARVLTIPTFRGEYFSNAVVRAIGARLIGARRVVVDVRDNVGGNYGAMLRASALFLEPGTFVSTLRQPRRTGEIGLADDDIDDAAQIARLERYAGLELRTPAGYPRYAGPVSVLVASDTGSAAEVFAEALRGRPGTRLMGWPTAGRVVLATYFPLPELGPNFSFAVPQAAMLNARGEDLEGRGVRPDVELFYDLEQSLRGEDSWINSAAR